MNTLERVVTGARARLNSRGQSRKRRLGELTNLLGQKKGSDWRRIDEPQRIMARARRLGFHSELRQLMEKPEDLELGAKVYEKIIQANDLLGVRFLFEGADGARAVGRITLPVSGGTRLGTGFMVSPRLMMTNNHVLGTTQQAGNATLELDFFERENGGTGPVTRFRLQPQALFLTDSPLDFTVVAVEEVNSQGQSITDRGWHRLIAESGKAVVGERVNIIQHPSGEPQQVAVHQNQIVDITGDFLHYQADTMGGSSGSPVFNDEWDLVALHHAAVQSSNEGVRVSRIVTRLQEMISVESTNTQDALLAELLSEQAAPRRSTPSSLPPAVMTAGPGPPAPQIDRSGRATWVVPLNITVGVGGASGSTPQTGAALMGGGEPFPSPQPQPPEPAPTPEQPLIFRHSELQEAFESLEVDELLDDVEEEERARFLERVTDALDALEQEDADADPDVMTVPQDRVASMMLSVLEEEPPDGSHVEALESGGEELKFAKNDVGGWLKSLFQRVKRDAFHPMLRPQSTEPEPLPGNARLALIGDWGTGLYGAPEIAQTLDDGDAFDALIHLGDVYYSGTQKEVQKRFLDLFPTNAAVRRALNSNHEMYSGGHAYFGMTLPDFGQASSYFALSNEHWLLVGLDTGYVDHEVDKEQVTWLSKVLAKAGDRRVVLLSHHQLFSWFDSQGDSLAEQLAEHLSGVTAWYWGHEHRCCLYDPDPRFNGMRARCVGHGGMPKKRGKVRNLPQENVVGDVIWRRRAAGDDLPGGLILDGPNEFIPKKEKKYLPHGYMTLELDGPTLIEKVHDPRGRVLLEQEL